MLAITMCLSSAGRVDHGAAMMLDGLARFDGVCDRSFWSLLEKAKDM